MKKSFPSSHLTQYPKEPTKFKVHGYALLIGVLVSIVFFAPASWLTSIVRHSTQNHVWLVETRGSLWNGSAQLLLAPGATEENHNTKARTLPTRIYWQLKPSGLGLKIELQSACCTSQAITLKIIPSFSGATAHLKIPTSTWPAELLIGLGTPWNTLQLQGNLVIETNSLYLQNTEQGQLRIDGDATLRIEDLQSSLSPIRPLGSYLITLKGQDESTQATLESIQGPLLLQGAGGWQGNVLRFTGEAKAEAGYQNQLDGLLNIIGRRQGNISRLEF